MFGAVCLAAILVMAIEYEVRFFLIRRKMLAQHGVNVVRYKIDLKKCQVEGPHLDVDAAAAEEAQEAFRIDFDRLQKQSGLRVLAFMAGILVWVGVKSLYALT